MAVRPTPEFDITFTAISQQLQQQVGHKLFTVGRVLESSAERIYSSQPDLYPVHGRKPKDTSEWTAMMERAECFVANHPDQFGPHFFDLPAIVAQGFGAVINIPVHDGQRWLGTLNLLDQTGAYAGPVLKACLAVRDQAREGFFQYEQWLAEQSFAPRPA